MYIEKLCNRLIEEIPGINIEKEAMMSGLTSFKVGGPADILVRPTTREELLKVVHLCKQEGIDFMVMGNGSNLLVRDGGIRGVVIQIYKNMNKVKIEGLSIHSEGGALMSEVSSAAYRNCFSGLEFAEGIPGTLGGAVIMNAGAYGGEMKDVISQVELIDPQTGEIFFYSNEEMDFGYRSSIAQQKGYIILSATMELINGDSKEIKGKMSEYSQRRRDKQPLSMASGGYTFRRPPGYFAGALIETSGLKGYRVGNAQVSEKHCGFVVNLGGATALEVEELIEFVKYKVFEKHQVMLETEIKIVGEKKE